jgi:hypothetical protein
MMQKRLSAKQANARKIARRNAKRVLTNPATVQVSGAMRAGKRKRGSSVVSGNAKSRKVRAVSGNVTREMLESAPRGTMVQTNSRGTVKIMHYNRPTE